MWIVQVFIFYYFATILRALWNVSICMINKFNNYIPMFLPWLSFDSYGTNDENIPDFFVFSIGSSVKLTTEVAYGFICTLSSDN